MARALKLFIDECLPERLPQQRREPSRNSLVVSSRICVERVWRSEHTKVRLGQGKFRSRGQTGASAPTCNVTLHALPELTTKRSGWRLEPPCSRTTLAAMVHSRIRPSCG